MKELRKRLKHTEPYQIRDKLIPELYFKDSENNIEYWVFYYNFVTRLSDAAIGVRLGNYDRHRIYKICIQVIENNYTIIADFLNNYKLPKLTTI